MTLPPRECLVLQTAGKVGGVGSEKEPECRRLGPGTAVGCCLQQLDDSRAHRLRRSGGGALQPQIQRGNAWKYHILSSHSNDLLVPPVEDLIWYYSGIYAPSDADQRKDTAC